MQQEEVSRDYRVRVEGQTTDFNSIYLADHHWMGSFNWPALALIKRIAAIPREISRFQLDSEPRRAQSRKASIKNLITFLMH